MSKKSRRRNKRLLAILALAGGAAFLGRGKGKKKFGTDAGFLKSGAAGGASLAADAAPKTQWIKKKEKVAPIKEDTVVTNVGSPYRKTGITRQSGVATSASGNKIPFFAPGEGKGSYIKDRKYETGEHSIPNLNPYKIPTKRVHVGRGVFKHGGKAKVTGIAKRGFGRALGKK